MRFMQFTRINALLVALVLFAGCTDRSDITQSVDERDPSVARLWNKVLLDAIRNDFARPTRIGRSRC